MATYGIIPHRLMPGVAGVPADAENLSVKIRRLPEYMTHDDCSGDEQCPRTYEEVYHDN